MFVHTCGDKKEPNEYVKKLLVIFILNKKFFFIVGPVSAFKP